MISAVSVGMAAGRLLVYGREVTGPHQNQFARSAPALSERCLPGEHRP